MISYSEFVKSCKFLTEIDKKSENGWQEVNNNHNFSYYLVKKRCSLTITCLSGNRDCISVDEDLFLKELEQKLPDDPLCISEETQEIFSSEFHIVYHMGFCVPILYFNIYDSSGKLLSLEEVWKIFSNSYPEILKDKWSSLTQGCHPHNGKPYFYCHPCNTENVMKFMKVHDSEEHEDVKYYIPSWLNIYGSAFGLSVASEYCCK